MKTCSRCGSSLFEELDPKRHMLTILMLGLDGRICHNCGETYTDTEFKKLPEAPIQ